MEIIGKILQIHPSQSGEGKNGTWKKQSFVIETLDEYPKTVCLTTWSNRVELDSMVIGEKIKVQFDVESREYNGRWYTDLKAWKSETIEGSNGSMPISANEIPPPPAEPDNEFVNDDDLPF